MPGLDLSRLKICFLAGTLGQGGAERQLFYILQALRRCGASLRLLSLTRGEFWEAPVRDMGVPVTWVGRSSSRYARLRQVIRELKADPPDVIQSQHFYTNLYVALAGRWLGIRAIGAIRNNLDSEVKANGLLMGNLSLHLPTTMVANSQAAVETALARKLPNHRLFVLKNAVDTDLFHPAAPMQYPRLHLLSVGRLSEQKRHDRFLRILSQLRQAAGDIVRGAIAGDGPLRAQLERQARDLGLHPPSLEFLGAVTDFAALAHLYRAASILVLTSDYEGVPNVILEAAASGLPVVASGVGGVPEVIQDGLTGFLVDPNDERSLVKRLLELVANPQLRTQFAHRARKFVENSHSLTILPQALSQLYERVMSGPQYKVPEVLTAG